MTKDTELAVSIARFMKTVSLALDLGLLEKARVLEIIHALLDEHEAVSNYVYRLQGLEEDAGAEGIAEEIHKVDRLLLEGVGE
ncbi:MAG: hypothetical protein V3T77_09140 [Planctomycetota bacterium]